MASLRKILYPFGVLYGGVTALRNYLFDRGILKSFRFNVPVIAVGNLSVGGTGKTPMVEYLIRLLSDDLKVAVLSRGYARKTSGFILASDKDSATTIGDEPFQYHSKFPNIDVAVDADRRNGIETLLKHNPPPEVILLDDAFQHRKIKAGLYILLTPYGDLFIDDLMLPAGNLRESKSGARRADIIVVTKCPEGISPAEQEMIKERLKVAGSQNVFFTSIAYDSRLISETRQIDIESMRQTTKVLVAGIAKPRPFFEHLCKEGDVIMEFPDHHHFSHGDISNLLQKADGKPVVTTEKDFTRLKGRIPSAQLYYLAIKTSFISESQSFDKSILGFVRKY